MTPSAALSESDIKIETIKKLIIIFFIHYTALAAVLRSGKIARQSRLTAHFSFFPPYRKLRYFIAAPDVFEPIFGFGNFEAYGFVRCGMDEFDSTRVKRKAAKRIGTSAVRFISRNRTAFRCEVRAYLIFFAGIEVELEKRVRLPPLYDAITGTRFDRFKLRLSAGKIQMLHVSRFIFIESFYPVRFVGRLIVRFRNEADIVRVVRKRRVDDAGIGKRRPFRIFGNGTIYPLTDDFLPRTHKRALYLLAQRKEHNAGRVAVEAVYDDCLLYTSDAADEL